MGFSAPRENTYVTWLEKAAVEAETQADEAEAVANGSWYVGGSTTSYYRRLELVEETRARAREYREEAEEQRRASRAFIQLSRDRETGSTYLEPYADSP